MFSGLSEYLFGSTSGGGESSDGRQNSQVQEMDTEDDWVLVDVTNDCDTTSPCRSPRKTIIKDNFESQPRSVPDMPHRSMEESWFITPPPCFMAGGHSPQQLATNPMEDLLIEHPSMSVYHHPGQRGGLARRPHHLRQKANRTVTRHSHNLRARNSKPPRRAAAVAARIGIEQSGNMAGVQEQQEAKKQQQRLLSRSKVERHNKAYHQQSASSRRHYRHNSFASGRHSGAIYKQPR